MSRKLYITAIFLMACSLGVLGYQCFDYLIVGQWPAVPLRILWETFFGPLAVPEWHMLARLLKWVGGLPMVLTGIAASYAVFLLSDNLRQP